MLYAYIRYTGGRWYARTIHVAGANFGSEWAADLHLPRESAIGVRVFSLGCGESSVSRAPVLLSLGRSHPIFERSIYTLCSSN